MKEISEYETNAKAFLKKHGITFRAERIDEACPPFCDGKHIHGDRHQVTIRRNGKRISFYFWNSQNDKMEGNPLDAYSVLACCSSDIHCPDTFEDFCSEFGYDQDSRKAEKTFRLCVAQAEKLNRIFDTEEIQAELSTIR